MNLKIKVTKEILMKSRLCGGNPDASVFDLEYNKSIQTSCAIALAVREIFPECFVSGHLIKEKFRSGGWEGAERGWLIELPEEAVQFISLFDSITPEQRVEMDEIEFEITVPQEVIDSISIEGIKDLIKDSKTLELV